MYAPNNRALKHVKKKRMELQGEIDESTVIAGDFNTPVSEMDRSRRQKISRDIIELNSTINQLDIIDISRLLHPRTADTHFSQAHMEHSPR